jgi:hypothetical protein
MNEIRKTAEGSRGFTEDEVRNKIRTRMGTYFEGIDLSRAGIIQKGSLTIETTIDKPRESLQRIASAAFENAIPKAPVATYVQILDDERKIWTLQALRKQISPTEYVNIQFAEQVHGEVKISESIMINYKNRRNRPMKECSESEVKEVLSILNL